MKSTTLSNDLFPKKLSIAAAFILASFLICIILFLKFNLRVLDEINSYHFPLLERNSINVRLSERLESEREKIVDSKNLETSLVDYSHIVETLEQNLQELQNLLLLSKNVRIDFLETRKPLKNLETRFLDLMKIGSKQRALELLSSDEFRLAHENSMSAIFDYAEDSSTERDQFLSKIYRLTLLSIIFSVVVLVISGGLSFRIYTLFASNLKKRDLLQEQLSKEQARSNQQSRLASLGEMAAGIAHEINNPLTIFSLHLRNIEKELRKKDILEPKIYESIEKSKMNVDRIARIIGGLKLFSRDGSHDEMKTFSVKKVIDEAIEIIQSKKDRVGADIINEALGVDVSVIGREVQIAQVLVNLISNSLDAIEELESRWIKISLDITKEQVAFKVMDSGLGIESDIAEKMLDPFYTTKDVNKGTGLGLSLSFEIAKQHGGDLYYNGRSKNTEFVLVLPKQVMVD